MYLKYFNKKKYNLNTDKFFFFKKKPVKLVLNIIKNRLLTNSRYNNYIFKNKYKTKKNSFI